MNSVSPINKAQRLTEAEVHAAAEELKEAGSKVSSIELYKHLGRGSLTTISNFMRSWRPGEEGKSTLPALISLPESLKAANEQLIMKIWAESQKMAETELQSQREALRQAEGMANEKIEEAQAFSDEQAKEIEGLKIQIEILREEAGKAHDFFLIEEKKLRSELDNAKKGETIFEQRFVETEKQLENTYKENRELKDRIETLEAEKIREIDSARKLERKLESEISTLKINESSLNEKISSLTMKIAEFKALSNQRDEALKEVAKLNGELEAWKTIMQKGEKEEAEVKKVAKKDRKKVNEE